jgi:O-6-methylguanine DNA methyltransferase
MHTSTRRVETVVSAPFSTAWGEGRVFVAGGRLVGVDLPPACPDVAGPEAAGDTDEAALAAWAAALEAYFSGERLAWTAEEIAVDNLADGEFERAVYLALLSIPPGQTISYGGLAQMAGYPRAARAVGNAMAANPVPVVIPCHRVIRADGSLGRYGDDPAWKARLLEHERTYVTVAPADAVGSGTRKEPSDG